MNVPSNRKNECEVQDAAECDEGVLTNVRDCKRDKKLDIQTTSQHGGEAHCREEQFEMQGRSST